MTTKLDLVDVTAIAKRLLVKPDTVHKWRLRYKDFPTPSVHLRIGPIWEWRQIVEWCGHRGDTK